MRLAGSHGQSAKQTLVTARQAPRISSFDFIEFFSGSVGSVRAVALRNVSDREKRH
jgi:hypothetical protein